jgi:hypothetical protein
MVLGPKARFRPVTLRMVVRLAIDEIVPADR